MADFSTPYRSSEVKQDRLLRQGHLHLAEGIGGVQNDLRIDGVGLAAMMILYSLYMRSFTMLRCYHPLVILMVLVLSLPGSLASADDIDYGKDVHSLGHAVLQASGVRGGLIVHLGCSDGQFTAALHGGDSYVVQGLGCIGSEVKRARDTINESGIYGSVSVAHCQGDILPYADGLVNLIVVTDSNWREADGELVRILAPLGIVLIQGKPTWASTKTLNPLPCKLKGWTKWIKPWPADIDQWTHYLHSPNNNAVARDSVIGPPCHFQWISGPRFSRSHDHLASVSAVVSAGGRLFSIVDLGSVALAGASPRWVLVARDAFSGVSLWQRDIPTWEYHLRDFRSGPADLARRLVAIDDRVYVTLGLDAPVTCLDAATGKTLHTYAGSEGTQEIICRKDHLFLVLGEAEKTWQAKKAQGIVSKTGYIPPFKRYTPPSFNKHLLVVHGITGNHLWQTASDLVRDILPSTLTVDEGNIYFQTPEAVVCLDAATGKLKWQTPRPAHRSRLAWSTPTLVAYDGIVYSADRKAAETSGELLWIPSGGYHEYLRGEVEGELLALDAVTGKRLWSCPAYEGFNSPVDILIADDLLWTGRYAWGQDAGITEARDLKTGDVRRRRPADQEFMGRFGHARCHRAKATTQYLVLGRRGVECVDLQTGDMIANRFVRGICQYGVLPANGLLYLPPHACACSTDDMIKAGYLALAPKRTTTAVLKPASDIALEQGPAWGYRGGERRATGRTAWPMYRHDPSRSGATSAVVSEDLVNAWTTDLGGRLSAPVISENRALVAQIDRHRVVALDAVTGHRRWTFTANARIDSAPTVYRGRTLFGSADGTVYCLRLTDGALVWRFHAAPRGQQIMVRDQLESVWPVSGSVLVVDDTVCFAAGRTTYLDGGMFLYKLDIVTGRVLKSRHLEIEKGQRDRGVVSGGCLPDVLAAKDASIFIRSARFDRDLVPQKENVPHLWSSVGFLDETWWHRTYWQYGTSMSSGWGGWTKAGQRVPAGRLLVTDGVRIVGFGRNQYDIPGAHVGVDGEGAWGPVGKGLSRWTFYRLFSRPLTAEKEMASKSGRKKSQTGTGREDWSRTIPVVGQAMVLARDTLFVAGPDDPLDRVPKKPSEVDPLAAALETKRGGHLLVLSATDGKTRATYPLASPPVFDGMAVTPGCVYLSSKAGQVVCWKGRD